MNKLSKDGIEKAYSEMEETIKLYTNLDETKKRICEYLESDEKKCIEDHPDAVLPESIIEHVNPEGDPEQTIKTEKAIKTLIFEAEIEVKFLDDSYLYTLLNANSLYTGDQTKDGEIEDKFIQGLFLRDQFDKRAVPSYLLKLKK